MSTCRLKTLLFSKLNIKKFRMKFYIHNYNDGGVLTPFVSNKHFMWDKNTQTLKI